MRIELQTVAHRAHASASAVTELARLASLGPLPCNQHDLGRLMANQGRIIMDAARELEFDCARLARLADVHTDLLSELYGQSVRLVDIVRGLPEPKDSPFAPSCALEVLAEMQGAISEKFPGDKCFDEFDCHD